MTGFGESGGRRGHAADAIVVLGGGVDEQGHLPAVARTRVRRAVELFEQGIAPRIVLSGRCGLSEEDPAITEAWAMAELAAELGVPREALLLEDESRDTLGNAFYTRERYLAPNGWRAVRVVTSDFHLSRAAWVFRKILGTDYDVAFASASSGLPPRELIFRALEECKLTIFLNEWLEALEEGNEQAAARLMAHEHPGYAEAPTLTHEQMRRRLDEIAHINQIAGTQNWIATGRPRRKPPTGERRGGDRRA